MRERDLDALRAGISEQVERDVRAQMWKANLDREHAKRHVQRAKVIPASELQVGDAVCSTDGWRFFKEELVVLDIRQEASNGQRVRDGEIWVVYDRGGSALRLEDPVLVEERS